MELNAFIEKYRAEVIKSKTNPKIISWSKLSEKKYRDSLCLFAADGVKLAQEALLYADVQFLAVSEKAARMKFGMLETRETNSPVSGFRSARPPSIFILS